MSVTKAAVGCRALFSTARVTPCSIVAMALGLAATTMSQPRTRLEPPAEMRTE